MRRALTAAALLLLCSMALGATVFREQVAQAAQAVLPVQVTNTAANPVPVSQQGTADVRVTNQSLTVQQQGTADVRVTNSSLSVEPQSPITSGGYGIGANAGDSVGVVPNTASAISLTMGAGVAYAKIEYLGNEVGFFYGPADGGQSSVVLALSRPIRIDNLVCVGSTGSCLLSWIGATP